MRHMVRGSSQSTFAGEEDEVGVRVVDGEEHAVRRVQLLLRQRLLQVLLRAHATHTRQLGQTCYRTMCAKKQHFTVALNTANRYEPTTVEPEQRLIRLFVLALRNRLGA